MGGRTADALSAMLAAVRAGQPGKLAARPGANGSGIRPNASVAVVPVYGLLMPRSSYLLDFFGGTGMDTIARAVREAAADGGVSKLILDVDSPGGTAAGCEETWTAVREAAQRKPVVAVCDFLMASAALWISSASSSIVATPSGQIGSVGVYQVREDWTRADEKEGVKVDLIGFPKFKTEGSPHLSMTSDERTFLEREVRTAYQDFARCVALGRRTTVDEVGARYGGGRLLSARDGVRAGLADRLATLEQTIQAAVGIPSTTPAYALVPHVPTVAAEKQRLRDWLELDAMCAPESVRKFEAQRAAQADRDRLRLELEVLT